jgi:phosphatidylserine/phosphatidylglycerophosphate/cardiolipin synthase-like enzyme
MSIRQAFRRPCVLLALLLSASLISGCLYPAADLAPCQTSIETYFPRAGEDPAPVLISLYNGAASSIEVAIYSFTHTGISGALVTAARRGVKVRVITNSDQSGSEYQKAVLASLLAAGVPIRVDTHSGLMHLKMSIIDHQLVTSGSYNYSNSASNSNDEVMMVIRDPAVVQECLTEFDRLWTATKGYRDYVP